LNKINYSKRNVAPQAALLRKKFSIPHSNFKIFSKKFSYFFQLQKKILSIFICANKSSKTEKRMRFDSHSARGGVYD